MLLIRRPVILVALSMILLLAGTAAAGDSSDRINTYLLNNHRIINLTGEFLDYWEAAKDKPFKVKRRLWKKTIEAKYKTFFDRAVYQTDDKYIRRIMLDDFLTRVPGRVDAIRQFNDSFKPTDNPVITSLLSLRARFPDYLQLQDVYVGFSFFSFDGSVRAVHNDRGIPDTLCIGVEIVADFTSEQLQIMLAHEFFHLYHFNYLFSEIDPAELSSASLRLMVEGLAVSGAEAIDTSRPKAWYLGLTEEEIAIQERDLKINSRQYLELIRADAPAELFEPWFARSVDGAAIPSRGGYFLGYEVTKRLLLRNSIEQLVHKTPVELRELAEEQLASMSSEFPVVASVSAN